MKKATIRNVTARLFAIVTLTTCMFAATANAQTGFVGRFNLPYEARWGKTLLPAGAYSITLTSPGTPGIVRSADGRTTIFTKAPLLNRNEKGPICLMIMTRGKEHSVRSLNLPDAGLSLVYEPLRKGEREMLAKAGQVQSLSITTAAK